MTSFPGESGGAVPLHFGPSDDWHAPIEGVLPLPLPLPLPLFGVWHPAEAVAPRTGVVICSAWGREEVCSHATLRHLAGVLAREGVPVLRFDAPGCGDSAGDAGEGGDWWAHWVAGVHLAIDELRARQPSVQQVLLVGLRLGATLALQVAATRADVAGCAALMPVVSGRRYLRELRALQSMQTAPSPSADSASEAVFESGGFAMTPDTVNAVTALDLQALTQVAPVAMSRLLVVDRAELSDGMPAWCEPWRAQGVAVCWAAVEGYDRLMLDPHLSELSQPLCEAVQDWVLHRADVPRVPTVSPPRLTLVMGGRIEANRVMQPVAPGVAECPVVVEAGPWSSRLWGVLSRPVSAPGAAASPRAVLILNAGAVRRTGPGRLWVSVARRLAAQGLTVLRLDLAGLGDSPPQSGEAAGVVYGAQALQEAKAALRYLKVVSGGAPCDVMGLCSGACHALQVALQADDEAAPLVAGIVAINPLRFQGAPGALLQAELPAHRVAGEVARYRGLLASKGLWRRLLRGQINPRPALRVLGRRVLHKADVAVGALVRVLGCPRADDLGVALRRLAKAGTRLDFVFAEGEPGRALLYEQGGGAVAQLQQAGALHLTTCPGADHTFTRRAAREHLLAVLVARLADGERQAHRDNAAREHHA